MKTLSAAEVIAIHSEVIAATGGSDGLRDQGVLESALAQPLMTFGGVELYPELIEKAAALGFSLIQNHPFIDGNKRIGWVVTRTLLCLNDMNIKANIDDAERAVFAVASSAMNRANWTRWLCEHLVEFKD